MKRLAWVLVLWAHGFAVAGAHEFPKDWKWGVPSGPVCGVYAVCNSLQAMGIETSPGDFWSNEFVGSSEGSTPDELCRALHSRGVRGTVQAKLSVADLYIAGCPVIANVRAVPEASNYSHWVCVVARSDGLWMADGPGSAVKIPEAEFLAVWSGIGILVDKGPSGTLFLRISRVICTCAVLGLAALLISSLLKSGMSSLAVFFRLLLASLILSCLSSVVFLGASVPTRDAGALALAPYSDEFEVSTKGLIESVSGRFAEGEGLLVDARYEDDFELGSIPGAINVPVSASFPEVKEFLSSVSRDVPILVFCQSATCSYDQRVANMLVKLRFSEVSVADVGVSEYREWKNAN